MSWTPAGQIMEDLKMHPKTHEILLSVILIAFVGSVVVFVVFEPAIVSHQPEISDVIFGALLLAPLVSLIYIYVVPIRCHQSNCLGRMHPVWHPESSQFRLRLLYQCNDCNEICTTGFTVGLGEPY